MRSGEIEHDPCIGFSMGVRGLGDPVIQSALFLILSLNS